MTRIHKSDARRHAHRGVFAVTGIVALVALAGCAAQVVTPGATSSSSAPASSSAAPTAAESATPEPTSPATTVTSPPPTGDEASGDETTGDEADGRTPVTVSASAAWSTGSIIEVRALVTDYVGDGTCTIAASGPGGESVEQRVEALPDAQSTVCPTATVEVAAQGDWSVTVTFANDTHYGVSDPAPVAAQ